MMVKEVIEVPRESRSSSQGTTRQMMSLSREEVRVFVFSRLRLLIQDTSQGIGDIRDNLDAYISTRNEFKEFWDFSNYNDSMKNVLIYRCARNWVSKLYEGQND